MLPSRKIPRSSGCASRALSTSNSLSHADATVDRIRGWGFSYSSSEGPTTAKPPYLIRPVFRCRLPILRYRRPSANGLGLEWHLQKSFAGKAFVPLCRKHNPEALPDPPASLPPTHEWQAPEIRHPRSSASRLG